MKTGVDDSEQSIFSWNIETAAERIHMLGGTPVLDVKPYLSGVPADQLKRGWPAEVESRS